MDTEVLARKYVGDFARSYDRERAQRADWRAEHNAVEAILARRMPGDSVLDVPVGTGRFAELYAACGLRATGVDTSDEMLEIASGKGRALGLDWELRNGDIRRLPWPDNSFDVAVCIRLFQWLGGEDLTAALGELARVTRQEIVFGVPIYMPLGKLKSAEDWKRWGLQWKLRFYKWRTHSAMLCHEQHVLDRALRLADLKVIETFPIHQRRHAYAIYVVAKG